MIAFSKPTTHLDQWGPFVTIDHFLSQKECSKLISQMGPDKLKDAEISEVGGKNTSIRSTKVCALEAFPQNMWVFQKLEEATTQVNNDLYKMDIVGFHEVLQLMEYNQGDHYDWHMDSGNLQFSQRKLSISVQLTDPSNYEGGDLEFFRNGIAPKKQGSMIIFPSYMHHKVHPITKGQRRALIAWIAGPPFR